MPKVNIPKKVKKGLKITGNVFFWIFFGLALTMTIFAFSAKSSATGAPQFGNTVLLSVESDSMKGEDGFKKNDIIICKVPESNEERTQYRVGDVIVFEAVIDGERVNNAHRIVYVDETTYSYQTKGDNEEMCPTPDTGLRSAGDVKAKWTGKKLTVLGPIISFLQTSVGFLCCIVLPLVLFFAYEVAQLVIIIRNARNKDKPAISAEQEEAIKQKAIEEFLKKQNQENNEKKNK